MHERNTKIFDYIASGEQHHQYWGNDVLPWLCPEGEVDLLIHVYEESAFMLCNESEKQEQLNILTELFSYLRYAEENHLIYVTSTFALPVKIYNFYENHDAFNTKSLQDDYEIGNGHVLHDEEHRKFVCKDEDSHEESLSNHIDISFLYDDIEHFLFGQIHAAYGLKRFIEHSYLSEQDNYSNRSLKVSRWSIWIAVGIAALSPILTVCIGNGFGKTTIVEHQYQGLKTISTIIDTLEIVRNDTVFIHDTIFKSSTQLENNKKK